jgi:uridine kinase
MKTVQITLPSRKTRTVAYGTRVSEIFYQEPEFEDTPCKIVAALINNELTSLSFKVEINASIKDVTLDSAYGADVYRRTLCFLLAYASTLVFPQRRLIISHSLGEGYYYYFDGMTDIPREDIRKLEQQMRELVEKDIPIERQVLSHAEALEHFKEAQQLETALLLEQHNDNKVPVYVCGSFMDLAHGPLAPCTSILQQFEIMEFTQGFLLRFPPVGNPNTIRPFENSPILVSIYKEYKAWGKILGVNSVARLNETIYSGDIQAFIRVAEALHDKKIAEIADKIHERRGEVKIVLIAGPSSSGKTTFAKKLSIQLRVVGFNPIAISLDDYFVPRHLTPRDENGKYDFEALEALDVELLNNHLIDLFDGKEVSIPSFDFKIGDRTDSEKTLCMDERSILIVEGIHGLNDRLTPLVEAHKKYKIYVSALTQLNLDDHNRISTTDNRLLRRIVRDFKFRGYSAVDTLSRWPSVRKGENKNIFPFQNNADSAFNSALDYELSVLKMYAEPLLKTVKYDQHFYNEALRLSSFLRNFNPLPANFVPRESILREFIGDSGFSY